MEAQQGHYDNITGLGASPSSIPVDLAMRGDLLRFVGMDFSADATDVDGPSDVELQITMGVFKVSFENNMHLHEGLEWSRVEAALEQDRDAMITIQNMMNAGHEPNVCYLWDGGFGIVTCSAEVPMSTMGCAYDPHVQGLHAEGDSNGNAEDMASAMGAQIINRQVYKRLVDNSNGEIDRETGTWLKTRGLSISAGYLTLGTTAHNGGADIDTATATFRDKVMSDADSVSAQVSTYTRAADWIGVRVLRTVKWADLDTFDHLTNRGPRYSAGNLAPQLEDF